ncbi:MAG: acyl-CoA thioesterase [Deltaproteobacteria bacterium]|nr:acyl-CoA thioesterase [Deltaproteobacteria bacterium]
MSCRDVWPPVGAATTTCELRVPFFDTDAMRVVHHANYVKYLELARVQLLDEHHRPYTEYVAEGLHFAVTRVELDYHQAARFDDRIAVTAWLRWVRGASLGVGYAIARGDELLVSGSTEHVLVDEKGRPRRLPKLQRAELAGLVAPQSG